MANGSIRLGGLTTRAATHEDSRVATQTLTPISAPSPSEGIRRVLLDEIVFEGGRSSPAAPQLYSTAGEFQWAVLGVLEDLEVEAFRPIEPEDDALAYFKSLVFTSNVCTCHFNSRSALCPVRVIS